MVDVHSTFEGAKTVTDEILVWVPVISSLAGAVVGGLVALIANYLNHILTIKREERAAIAKRSAEQYFLATELVFKLERFAETCAEVASDAGEVDDKGYTLTTVGAEDFTLDDITADWRVLPQRILYRIRELTVMIPEANRFISFVSEYDNPPDWGNTFYERRYQYARLGLRAVLLAKRLRRLAGMPSSRRDGRKWSAQQVLWEQWRKGRKLRAKIAREDRQERAGEVAL